MNHKKLSKIVFIVPYYGSFPHYFDIWLLSAAYNPTVDFLLVTDIALKQKMPQNVTLLRWSWKELLDAMQAPFNFRVNVKTPYHLCDFRPAYGIIFQKYIQKYDFWGNCDIDQVFGDIRKYMTEDILEKHDIIGYLGHFLLYRNHARINNIFRLKGGAFDYKTVFSTDEWYSFGEHTGIKQIVEKNEISHYFNQEHIADIITAHKQLKIGGKENFKYQVFYWENGKIFKAYIEDGVVRQKEYMYIHFQKKNPLPAFQVTNGIPSFYIFADSFMKKKPGIPERKDIIKYSCWHGKVYELYEICKKWFQKLRKFIQISRNQKIVWIKQRKYRKKYDI